ncbi:hypothetical protein BCU30_011320 [Vibrio lentus]|uniref:hypothetical protein n=1 Tax=Vibrio lentus TaxID=136468 RepID=UPI0007EEACCD|nr:hypothetical protein [Vibrio lentus]OBT26620.1 hypothetical protein A9266_08490 [Vibrio tasmaniensis]PMG24999.1 hypothetical protein BCU96_05905 [Vibrio lentus]PMH09192.1 hypothetical protein BCU76_07545 [Vibrio lentus]PMI42452.1 hypothetical protein BCU45_18210 [Vibrio lentus]PMI65077.1 hypothetical protein BCU40_19225 [Vibrio lentus]
MNSYVILHRDKVAVAVDLMSATSSSDINRLKTEGFFVEEELIDAKTENEAISEFQSSERCPWKTFPRHQARFGALCLLMALGLAILQAIAYCSELRDAYGKTEVLLYFQISLLALIVMCLIYMIFGCLSILKGQNDKVLLIN